jgi:hypothetical protein
MDINAVRRFFSGKSKMTIHRWMNDPNLNFPRPTKICTQNYWTRRQLLEFVERQRLRVAAPGGSQVPKAGSQSSQVADTPRDS